MYIQVYMHHVLCIAEEKSGAHLAFEMFEIVTVLSSIMTTWLQS